MRRCYIIELLFSFRENVWMDDVSLSSVGRLFQMTAADTANAMAPTTVLVHCADSFMVSAERRRRRQATAERPRCSRLPSTTGQDRGGS